MIKSILRPRSIFVLIGALAAVGLAYFSYNYSGSEIYSNQSANASDSGSDWKDAFSKLGADTISENLTPAQDLGVEPNLTDALLQSLTNTLGPRLIQEGGLSDISQTDIQSAAQYLPEADAILPAPIEITAADIIISEKNDAESVKKYFNSVFAVYEKTFFTLKEDEFSIIGKALETEKYSDIQKISEITVAFEKSFAGVKAIPVPRGWENFALKELSFLSRSQQVTQKLQNSGSDLILVLILLPKRALQMEEINKFHKESGHLLKSKGILFIQNTDKGYNLLY